MSLCNLHITLYISIYFSDPWQSYDVYMVHYAAVTALGLLVRADPGNHQVVPFYSFSSKLLTYRLFVEGWWNELSGILGKVLLDPRRAAAVKSRVALTYGKLGTYLQPGTPYFKAIKVRWTPPYLLLFLIPSF